MISAPPEFINALTHECLPGYVHVMLAWSDDSAVVVDFHLGLS